MHTALHFGERLLGARLGAGEGVKRRSSFPAPPGMRRFEAPPRVTRIDAIHVPARFREAEPRKAAFPGGAGERGG